MIMRCNYISDDVQVFGESPEKVLLLISGSIIIYKSHFHSSFDAHFNFDSISTANMERI